MTRYRKSAWSLAALIFASAVGCDGGGGAVVAPPPPEVAAAREEAAKKGRPVAPQAAGARPGVGLSAE